MTSRDFRLREVYHDNIAEYIRPMPFEEFGRFIETESIRFRKNYWITIKILRHLNT